MVGPRGLRVGPSLSRPRPVTGRLVAVLLLCAASAGCGGGTGGTAAARGVFLVAPTARTQSWRYDLAVEGLERAGREAGAPFAARVVDGEEELRVALRQLGGGGAEVVFCLCPDAEHVVFAEAAAARATHFVVIGGTTHTRNVSGIVFRLDEAAQLAGALAAALSGPSPVGVISGPAVPPWLEGAERAFARGVASAAPGRPVLREDGPFAVEELALAGVKVVFYLADPADPALLRGCQDSDLTVVTTDGRTLDSAPEIVVATLLVDLPEAMSRLAAGLRSGEADGQVHAFPLGTGLVDLRLNDRLSITREPEVRAALYRAREEILGGITEIERLGIGR